MKDDFDLTKLRRPKSKRINSKAKGGRFERKIAHLLNERFKTTEFCRTPGSGAFATTHSLPCHLKIYGDLITPKDFKFIIECKSGYNKEGICNLFNPDSLFSEMIAQAERDSEKCFKKFLLIIGQDRKDPIIVTNENVELIGTSFDYYSYFRIREKRYYLVKLSDLFSLNDRFFL